MGIETAIFVAAIAGKAAMQVEAADAQEEAIELKGTQMRLQYQQKTLSNYDQTEKVLQAQESAMSVRGVGLSSPSFNAIQRNTLNISGKQQKNFDIENTLQQRGIDVEKDNVEATLFSQLFGDVAESASGAYRINQSQPYYEPPTKSLPDLDKNALPKPTF